MWREYERTAVWLNMLFLGSHLTSVRAITKNGRLVAVLATQPTVTEGSICPPHSCSKQHLSVQSQCPGASWCCSASCGPRGSNVLRSTLSKEWLPRRYRLSTLTQSRSNLRSCMLLVATTSASKYLWSKLLSAKACDRLGRDLQRSADSRLLLAGSYSEGPSAAKGFSSRPVLPCSAGTEPCNGCAE